MTFGPTTYKPGGPWGYGQIEGLPVSGPISSPYGDPRSGGPHTGLDIAIITGTPILAPAAGVVDRIDHADISRNGKFVALDHADGTMSVYLHMSAPALLSPGAHVAVGAFLGASGSTGFSTGPHLHWGVFAPGTSTPLDPLSVIDGAVSIDRGTFVTENGIGMGVTSAVWQGGTVSEMAAAAASEGAVSVTVFVDGQPLVLIPGAPAFVNKAMLDRFPVDVPIGTIVFVAT